MLVGAWSQDVGISGADIVKFVVLLDVALAADDVFENEKVAVLTLDFVGGVLIGNTRHIGPEVWRFLPGVDGKLLIFMVINISAHRNLPTAW